NCAMPTAVSEEGISEAVKRGDELVGKPAYGQGTTDGRQILNKFRAANPDILLTRSEADDGIAIARQIKEVGLDAEVVAIDTASSMMSFIQQVGAQAENIVSAVSWSPDVKYEGTPALYERP